MTPERKLQIEMEAEARVHARFTANMISIAALVSALPKALALSPGEILHIEPGDPLPTEHTDKSDDYCAFIERKMKDINEGRG